MKNSQNSNPVRGDAALNEELEFLREKCGLSGKSYNLYLTQISRSPVVLSHSTRKYFMLPSLILA
jgi:hypothetical protein